MRKTVLKMGFNAFSGLHGGLVLFEKIYLNPRSQIGLIWEKTPFRAYTGVIFENGRKTFNAFSGLHGGLVLFEKIYLNPRSQIGLI
jgi:hypothetical protein